MVFVLVFSIVFVGLVPESYSAKTGDIYTISGSNTKNCSFSYYIPSGSSYSLSSTYSHTFTLESSEYLEIGHKYKMTINNFKPVSVFLSNSSNYYVLNGSSRAEVQNYTLRGVDLPEISNVYYTPDNTLSFEFECTAIEDFIVEYTYMMAVFTNSVTSTTSYSGVAYYNLIWNYDIVLEDITPRTTNDILEDIDSGIQQGNQLQEESNKLQEEQNETTNNIFTSISDFFGSFFENLIGIFVPEDDYFEDFFNRLNEFFSDKLGMLYAPIDLFLDMLNVLLNADASDAGIVFPEIKWQEYTIIPETRISLGEYSDEVPELQEYIYFGTDIIMVGAVLNLLQNKLKEVLKN